ncbi:MAG: hypothetical protein COV47_03200 [Candidatus Diapherotrites archaeon CG11_big_fil_rev_8_21_14_0_20_37_9]|nr:MAG: hypothetical protein COV47_03200 [Candidatus Diapherotrites archaeon CG11_big_fil_rev_8_21_14_0_20_37_9]
MKTIIIAPLGGDIDTIFVGIREFSTEKIILVPGDDRTKDISKIKEALEKFKIPIEIEPLKSMTLEAMFETVNHIRQKEKGKQLAINLGPSSKLMSCAATAAAFVNGIKAFDVTGDKITPLPVLKFSYYDMLSDKKMKIIEKLRETEAIESLEILSKKTGMGPSLVNYHIYGNEKNHGLKELGLVEITRKNGKVAIALTTMGELLLKEKQGKK